MAQKKQNSDERAQRVMASPLTQEDADRFEEAAPKIGRWAARNKKTARETLVVLGTHTKTGRLTKNYRG